MQGSTKQPTNLSASWARGRKFRTRPKEAHLGHQRVEKRTTESQDKAQQWPAATASSDSMISSWPPSLPHVQEGARLTGQRWPTAGHFARISSSWPMRSGRGERLSLRLYLFTGLH